jgi:hypothetical protein
MPGEQEPEGPQKAGETPGDRQGFDTSVAHSARVHDYWLGGKDNYVADRAAGDAVIAAYPGIVKSVRANRAFLARVVRFLAGESTEQGTTDYIDADLREPENFLQRAAQTLDFSRPVAIMLIAIMHLIVDQDDPYGTVARLLAAVPAGSYLALSQVASDIEAEQMAEAAKRYNRLARETQRHRTQAEVARFFDGLELLEPGLVPVQMWRPDSEIEAKTKSAMWGGVGYKR